jgi:DUF1680 family protein
VDAAQPRAAGITGEAVYAEEIERTAYNDLLARRRRTARTGATTAYPNGRRVYTTYWRCCKSSGAMALEELPGAAYALRAGERIDVNLYGEGRAILVLPGAGQVLVQQRTGYPFDGAVNISVSPTVAGRFTLALRLPTWAEGASATVNGEAAGVADGGWLLLERDWQAGDVVSLILPMHPRLHHKVSQNTQESLAPDGSQVAQQVMRYDYVAITRGPLVYATGLIDGFKTEETLRLPEDAELKLELAAVPVGSTGPAIRLHLGYRPPLSFSPYFEAGGRVDGSWRLTWMQLAP